jgi:predicted nucleic acid-binding protein
MTRGCMKLIDANLFIYAVGDPHPYRQASRKVMRDVRAGLVETNVSTEILQKVLNYHHRRQRTAFAVELFDDLVSLFPDPYPIDLPIAVEARNVLEQYPFLQTRDAFHAAVVFQHRLEGIISADRAFDRVVGLKRFDPKELAA